uniref:GRF-type domain-containing protein n=1 Tax=Chenopodium quinoa TaxID=63459 RepID=A0A803L7M5_CHEQI
MVERGSESGVRARASWVRNSLIFCALSNFNDGKSWFDGSGSRSRSKGNSSPAQVYCYHDEVAPLRTVRHNGPTKGKRFYGCSYWPFRVLDKDPRLCELEDENDSLREKVKKLKAKKEELEDKVAQMGIATTETMLELKEHNTDKRLMLTLIFS